MKPLLVWCAVTPRGRLLEYTASRTKREAWEKLLKRCPIPAKPQWLKPDCGFTVRRFRLEAAS